MKLSVPKLSVHLISHFHTFHFQQAAKLSEIYTEYIYMHIAYSLYSYRAGLSDVFNETQKSH